MAAGSGQGVLWKNTCSGADQPHPAPNAIIPLETIAGDLCGHDETRTTDCNLQLHIRPPAPRSGWAAPWTTPGLWLLPSIVVAGTMGLCTHYCMARAMALADASVVVPLDFLRRPLIALVGALFYEEPVQALLFVGAALILSGNLFSLWAERRKKISPVQAGKRAA
jgi:hypothetical protein